MSENINETTRHLKFRYISILTNLLWTDNEMKSVKTILHHIIVFYITKLHCR